MSDFVENCVRMSSSIPQGNKKQFQFTSYLYVPWNSISLGFHGAVGSERSTEPVSRVTVTPPSVSVLSRLLACHEALTTEITMTHIPAPRLCRLSRSDQETKFGFHLTGTKNKPGISYLNLNKCYRRRFRVNLATLSIYKFMTLA